MILWRKFQSLNLIGVNGFWIIFYMVISEGFLWRRGLRFVGCDFCFCGLFFGYGFCFCVCYNLENHLEVVTQFPVLFSLLDLLHKLRSLVLE